MCFYQHPPVSHWGYLLTFQNSCKLIISWTLSQGSHTYSEEKVQNLPSLLPLQHCYTHFFRELFYFLSSALKLRGNLPFCPHPSPYCKARGAKEYDRSSWRGLVFWGRGHQEKQWALLQRQNTVGSPRVTHKPCRWKPPSTHYYSEAS